MIDVSRHFQPVEVIKRTLDGMAAVKLNVFHWHLSDDQGFRIESKAFPKLTGMGSDGLFYTQDQAREVIAYARERGIRVVPEFDIPGHALSWMVGYPELASGTGPDYGGPYQVERQYGIFDPVMDPTRESTYKFLDLFIGEMAEIFPDPFMHVGGDENNGVQWKANPRIQEFMKDARFEGHRGAADLFQPAAAPDLKKHGKTMVGWDEIFAPGLSKDAVIQSWRGFDSLAATAKAGYQRDSFRRLLSRSHRFRRAALPGGSAAGRQPDTGGAGTDPWRRGMHVERACIAAQHRFAYLAAHGRDCRAAVVGAEREQRR